MIRGQGAEFANIVEGVYEKYGYDFRDYSPSTLKRRIKLRMIKEGVRDISEFKQSVLSNEVVFAGLLNDMSIDVTEMFRDPPVFACLRKEVIPVLATYPHIRIWSAGIATGEEPWSLAILLKEAGLYERSLIYATDFNINKIRQARTGVFPLDRISHYSSNYYDSDGSTAFYNYYRTSSTSAVFDPSLRKNIIFSTHNLATDHMFNEFHLILCRNVMIYFNDALNERVLNLFTGSLVDRGFLCIGTKESLRFRSAGKYYTELSKKYRIYKRVV